MRNLKPGWYWYYVPSNTEEDKNIVRIEEYDESDLWVNLGDEDGFLLSEAPDNAIFEPVCPGSKEKWDALLDAAKKICSPLQSEDRIEAEQRLWDTIKAVAGKKRD